MKFTVALLAFSSLLLTSCNTTIGLWRDTKAGVIWTKNKIQNSGNSGGGGGYQSGGSNSSYDGEYGAPIY